MRSKIGGAIRNHHLFDKNFMKLLHDKQGFLLLVFLNLMIQLYITYYFMMNSNKKKEQTLFIHLLTFIILLILTVILSVVQFPSWIKFIIFSIYSGIFGYYLSYLKYIVDPAIIQAAIVGSGSIFATMLLFGFMLVMMGVTLGVQFGGWLLFALLLLIISRIVVLFLGNYSTVRKIFAIVSLFLFSLYIIYDTNVILQRNYQGDFITASLDYYLDINNIFINIVDLSQ